MSPALLVPRPAVAVVLLTLTGLYLLGWSRLLRRGPGIATDGRLALALGGSAALTLALSPLVDEAAHARFSAHMLQHLLLTVVAAPALVLAAPLAITLWALPRGARRAARPLLAAGTAGRSLLRALTSMPLAWTLHAAALWLWHLPSAYEAALGTPWLHDLEHMSFLVTAVFFWWPVIEPAPRLRPVRGHGVRLVYLVLGAFQAAALGVLLALAPVILYPAYAGADALEDQALGGVLMWALGGAGDMLAVGLLLWRFLVRAEAAPVHVS